MMAPPITLEHDGLTQRTEGWYQTSSEGKRHFLVHPQDAQTHLGPIYRRLIRMRLPLNSTPAMWLRHNYSLADVVATLDCFRSIHLWQLAVLLTLPIANSSVKLGFSTPISMHFSSKAQVIYKLTSYLNQTFTFGTVNILDTLHMDHVPPLPVHRLPMKEYQRYASWVLPTVQILQINECPHVWWWNRTCMVSLRMEGDALYAVRVLTESVFHASQREHRSLATTPLRLRHTQSAELLYGVMDEAAFFLPG